MCWIHHRKVFNFAEARTQPFAVPYLSPAAILQRIHPIPSELGSEPLQGPGSTGVGDRLGSPSGAAGFLFCVRQKYVLVLGLLDINFRPLTKPLA